MPVALVTGGSAGLGRALTHALADAGWTVPTDGRRPDRLAAAARPGVHPIAGDVADEDHRHALARQVDRLGRLDLLVHNASTLGPLPLRPLRDVDEAHLRTVWEVNTAAPHALTRLLLPHLSASDGVLVSISSDAAVEHYETWGAYAASKAALDHLDPHHRRRGADRGVRRRPRRPAHRAAPGGVPRRGHLRPAAAGDRRTGPGAARLEPSTVGALPAGRPAGGGVMRLLDEQPATLRGQRPSRPPPPRSADSTATPPVCLVARPDVVEHARFRDLARVLRAGDVVVVNNSATVAGSSTPSPTGAVPSCCMSRPRSTTAPGSSSCVRRPTRPAPSWTPDRARRCAPDPCGCAWSRRTLARAPRRRGPATGSGTPTPTATWPATPPGTAVRSP